MALLFLLQFQSASLSACDTSGFVIDGFTDNGDGTFTVDMTINVAGSFTTVCGSTWGFFWNTDVPIVSLSPPSLTSINGTTLVGIVAGTTITWGDPTATWPTVPFVDAEPGSMTADESFQVSIVLGGFPNEWSGGGQEANTCPNGGCSANPAQYGGPFPCLTPNIVALGPFPPSCPGDPVTLSVLPDPPYLVDNIVWQPGGLTGTTVTVNPTETTEYTVTASNNCEEFSLTITQEVIPFPTIEPLQSSIESCEGLPVVMEVSPMNELLVEWEPGGMIGNVLIETPTTNPTIYTITASNQCGEALTNITVTTTPSPTIDIPNDEEIICVGESIELESDPTDADNIEWLPGGANGENITVMPDTTTQYTVIATSNCGVAFDSVTVLIASTDTMQVSLEACEGESVMYNGIPLVAGTSSVFTFQNLVGCDSVVNVTVEELPTYAAPLTLEACEGSTVMYEGVALSPGDVMEFTFTAVNSCDSVVTVSVTELSIFEEPLELFACENGTVTYEGQALAPGEMMNFTFPALNGCDSTVMVSVSPLSIYDIGVTLETCTGTTIPYNGQNLAPGTTTVFNLSTLSGCDSTVTVTVDELAIFTTDVTLSACTGSTATYNGSALLPGSVTDFTFATALGCDSVVTVTVNEVAIIEEQVELSACAGNSAAFDGQDVPAGTSQDFNYVTAQGCDSVVTVMVEALPTYTIPLTLEACVGASVTYEGQELFAGTTTDVMLTTASGCDSVMSVTVDELNDVAEAITLSACNGESVLYNGQTLDAGTTEDFTFMSAQGCDSVVTVTVEEFPTYNEPLSLQACTGATVIFQGVPLPPGTTVDFTLSSINGCDSIISVTVEEVETIFTDLEFETCAGTFITYNGDQLPPGSQTDYPFVSVNGCDSVVTVTVEETGLLTGIEILEACAGSTIPYNGQDLAPGTVTDVSLLTALGCDSVVTVVVNELPIFAAPLTLQACSGSTVMYDGQALAPNTVTDFTFSTINGCDSVITVTVNEVMALTESITLEACVGENIFFNGQVLTAGSVTDFNLVTAQGCDSILTVTVDELQAATGTFTSAACEGESIQYNGQSLLAGSVTDITLAAANGCDSVVTVTVDVLEATSDMVTLQGCQGETLMYNGTVIAPGTSMDFTLSNAVGCDSIITVTALDPIPFVETEESIEVCEGESTVIFGQVISEPGVYDETYTSINGCDSIHRITLNIATDVALAFDNNISIGLGESVQLQPIVPAGSNLTYNWTEDPSLSCFDCPNPVASPLLSTTYFLTITNDLGCNANSDVLVIVKKERDLYVPNSFSPNGDGVNDLFMIFSGSDIVSNIRQFNVFSRWGEPVFSSTNFLPNDPTFGWDGLFRGNEVDAGVFAYMIEVEFIDGVTRILKGDVTIIR